MATSTLKTTAQIKERLENSKGRVSSNYGNSANEELIAEISLLYTILHEDTPLTEQRLEELNGKVDSLPSKNEREVVLHEISVLEWVLGK